MGRGGHDGHGRRGGDGRHGHDRDETLAEAYWAFARVLRHASMKSLSQWEITPAQARVLKVLRRHGTIRPSVLAEHLRIAPRSVTEVVDDLVTKGLVARSPDPHDRRAQLLALTEHGVEVGHQIRAARGADAERVFGRLSDTDRAHLARILRILRE